MSKVKKVSKTRKMKMKQRFRHRKSRVIKTKSRKNRYRRTPKYKVGGGTLDPNVFNNIRAFIENNGNTVENAENRYTTFYNGLHENAKSRYLNPAKITGTFFKKNRLHDILEKIKAVAADQTTLDVREPEDYHLLSTSITLLYDREAKEMGSANANRAIARQISHETGILVKEQQSKMKDQGQMFRKVFISDSDMITIPDDLQLFELDTDTKVTGRIPKLGSKCQVVTINQQVYDSIVSDQITNDIVNDLGMSSSYHYKRDPDAHNIYYVHGDGISEVTRILTSLSSKNYEYRMTPQDNCTDPAALEIVTKPVTDPTKNKIIQRLWGDANCLLKRYYDIFSKVNLNIVSPSRKYSLNSLHIGTNTYYEQGKFTDITTVSTVVVYDKAYDQAYRQMIESHRGSGGPV
jgi:hypothetical protein